MLLDFISEKGDVSELFHNKDLANVEPFTVLTIEQDKGKIFRFNECIWDGSRKHFRELDQQQAYVWSSVTLYSEEHRNL